MSNSSKTNWAKVDALTDQTIDTSDIPPLDDSFFAKAKLRVPVKPVPITLQVDSDVLNWFHQTGPDWEDRIRAALRLYALAHKSTGPSNAS